MKVMVYASPGKMRIEERPEPQPAAGEVVLRILASGICGSDLHGYRGHDPTRHPGMVLGHELSGIVVATTDPAYPEGTLVSANSAVTCGRCDYCIQGRDNLCVNRRSLGKHRQGAYAQFVAVPTSAIVDVPQNMEAVRVALTEPLANGVHAVTEASRLLARPLGEASAAVFGGGGIGFLAVAALQYYGCREVTLVELNAERRAAGERYLGCRTACWTGDRVPAGAFDLVLDAVGSSATMASALRAVRPAGVISQIGLNDHHVDLDIQKLVRAQITLAGSANYTMMALRAAVKLLASDILADLSWLDIRSLEDGPAAFADLASNRVAAPKIVLLPAG